MSPKTVLGVDLGFSVSKTALAIVSKEGVQAADHLEIDKGAPFRQKLHTIVRAVEGALLRYNVDKVEVEDPTIRGRGGYKFKMILGAIVYMMHKRPEVELEFITPNEVKKKITGNGKATKKEMADTLWNSYEDKTSIDIMSNAIREENFDITDAIAIAECGVRE